jgi:ABC-type nickel/cobalt efflux system permease component RcnA
MNSSLISASISLMVITGGMFLLAKAKIEMLGKFFKVIAYFIIIVGFLNLGTTFLHCVMRSYGNYHFYSKMNRYEQFKEKHSHSKKSCSWGHWHYKNPNGLRDSSYCMPGSGN